ncbi:MAG: hypothetical protein AABZ53_02665 [Planctomycetota bacterium]
MTSQPSSPQVADAAPAAPLCGICGAPSADLDSHIIPRFAQRRLKDGDRTFVVVDPSDRRVAFESENRFYQRGLLCQECEAKTAKLDAYWATIWDGRQVVTPAHRRPFEVVVHNVDAVNVARLLVSILLRAHAATQPEFAKFTLGGAFDAAVKAFQTNDPLGNGFRTRVWRTWSPEFASTYVVPPFHDRALRAVVVAFSNYRFAVALPTTRWEGELKRLSSHPISGGLLATIARLESFVEFKEILRTAQVGLESGRMKLRFPR